MDFNHRAPHRLTSVLTVSLRFVLIIYVVIDRDSRGKVYVKVMGHWGWGHRGGPHFQDADWSVYVGGIHTAEI